MKTLVCLMLLFLAPCRVTGDDAVDWKHLEIPSSDREEFDESQIPESVRKRFGESVKIRGYMMVSSVFTSSGIRRFGMWAETKQKSVNVNSWTQLPLHCLVFVEMNDDFTTDFVGNGPIEVTGRLVLDIVKFPDGRVASIYKIQADRVMRAQKREGFHAAAEPGC